MHDFDICAKLSVFLLRQLYIDELVCVKTNIKSHYYSFVRV